MISRHTIGDIPPKPHTALYLDDPQSGQKKLMMEHCATRQGFQGAFSILYYRTPPTDEFALEACSVPDFCPVAGIPKQDLQRRALNTGALAAKGDFLSGRKTLFISPHLQIGVIKAAAQSQVFFSNADGDELYFVNDGHGVIESIYGVLPFKKHDYVLIPKATPYRVIFESHSVTLLVFEGRPHLGIPSDYRNDVGQLSMYAPYSHRDFRCPERLLCFSEEEHGKPPYRVVTKHDEQLIGHLYQSFPFDIVGWDGALYPTSFSIHDFQPKTGLIHLPPTIHTTFSGKGFVICSFVPRLVDYHPQAIPCPYGHGNNDMDEFIYYVEGNFSSRKGIEREAMSLHPRGIAHGPHPGTYEASMGNKRTEELAVMCDTYDTLSMTPFAQGLELGSYHGSWVKS